MENTERKQVRTVKGRLEVMLEQEIESLDSMLWLTPYLGRQLCLMRQLKSHLESARPVELRGDAP